MKFGPNQPIRAYTKDLDQNHEISLWSIGREQDWFEVFPAVVLQHEMDHLDGVTLLNHSSRLKRSRYLSRQKKRRLEG